MLRHRLALRLGRTIEELEEALTADEFFRWKAFNLIEPVGDDRMDILIGLLASVVANTNGNKSTADDFIPRWGESAIKALPSSPQEEAEQTRTVMRSLFKRLENARPGPVLVRQD